MLTCVSERQGQNPGGLWASCPVLWRSKQRVPVSNKVEGKDGHPYIHTLVLALVEGDLWMQETTKPNNPPNQNSSSLKKKILFLTSSQSTNHGRFFHSCIFCILRKALIANPCFHSVCFSYFVSMYTFIYWLVGCPGSSSTFHLWIFKVPFRLLSPGLHSPFVSFSNFLLNGILLCSLGRL